MTSNGAFGVRFVIAIALIPYVSSIDYITNVTATDIGIDHFTLEWTWVLDPDDDFDPWGCRIVTRTNDNMQMIVSQYVVEGTNMSYTVNENLRHWQLYKSCITPIITNGTVRKDGTAACSDTIQTKYDTWTLNAQIAVIISGGLLFLLIVAQLINFKWPREKKRTFALDENEDDDEDEIDKPKPDNELNNFGFEQDEDATSVVNDWNAAAAMAAAEASGATTQRKQWIKTDDVHHHASTRLFYGLEDPEDGNNNGGLGSEHDNQSAGSRDIGNSEYDGEGAAYPEGGYPLSEEPVYSNEQPQQAQSPNRDSEMDYHLAYQPGYVDEQPGQQVSQRRKFPSNYSQGNPDPTNAPYDMTYENYGYEDYVDQYGYD